MDDLPIALAFRHLANRYFLLFEYLEEAFGKLGRVKTRTFEVHTTV